MLFPMESPRALGSSCPGFNLTKSVRSYSAPHIAAVTVNAYKQLELKKKVKGGAETFKEQKMQLEFHPRHKNLTWSTWALTSLPALLFTGKPAYLHYMDSSPFQDRKLVFTDTDGNQQEEHNGSPHLQGRPYREASLPRRNSLLYQLQIHCNIPIRKNQQFISLWAGMENKNIQKAGKYHYTSQTSKGSEAGGVKTFSISQRGSFFGKGTLLSFLHVPMENSISQKPWVQSQPQSPKICGSTDMMSLDSFWDP